MVIKISIDNTAVKFSYSEKKFNTNQLLNLPNKIYLAVEVTLAKIVGKENQAVWKLKDTSFLHRAITIILFQK